MANKRFIHHSLKDLVVEHIRKSILDGELPLGVRLTETEVAEELGISRGPVREAFLDLFREGLLELTPRRGARVTTLAPDDIWELYTLRGHLESLLVRHAWPHVTSRHIDYLQQLVDDMEALPPGSAGVVRKTELDLLFHGHIAQICPYPRMVQAYCALDGQVGAGIYTVTKYAPDSAHGFAEKHQLVVDALRTGDLETAAAAVEAHWTTTADRILSGSRQHAEEGQH